MFGSHAKNIKDVLLGIESPQPLEFTKKRPRSVKIVKRDSRSIRMVRILGHLRLFVTQIGLDDT